MPSVQDYLNAQKLAERSIETMRRVVRQAADAAQASTKDGHYDGLEELVDEGKRTRFTEQLTTGLVSYVKAAADALPEEQFIAEDMTLGSFYGFTSAQLAGFVDGVKGDFTFDRFMGWLNSPETEYRRAQARRAQAPLSTLNKVSVAEVAAYVKLQIVASGSGSSMAARPGYGSQTTTTPAVPSLAIRRPDLVTLNDKRELVALFEEHGVVPPKYVENKPYMKA